MSDNGKKPQESDHLDKLTVDGKEYKVVNTCTMIEIIVHKLDNGQEIQQVIAQEFMMTDHKSYMIKALTDAINTVAQAVKRKPEKSLIKTVSEAAFNKMRRSRIKDKFPRR